MATQKYSNLGQGALNIAYTAGNTTLTLNSGQGATFPSSGDFMVALDSPPTFYLKCTSRSGDVLTVTSTGQESTTAVNKTSGVVVTEVITAGALDSIRQDMNQAGAVASLPATSEMHTGDKYQCSDAPILFRYNGSTFDGYYQQALSIPKWSDFTTTDSSSITGTLGGIVINGANNTGNTALGTATYTTTPITVVMGFTGFVFAENFGFLELYAYDSVTTKAVSYGYQQNGSPSIVGQKYNAGGGFNANYFSNTIQGAAPFGPGSLSFMRYKDDGTNRTFSISPDGLMWSQISTIGRTDFCTPNQFGWTVAGSTNHPPCCRIVHFKVN